LDSHIFANPPLRFRTIQHTRYLVPRDTVISDTIQPPTQLVELSELKAAGFGGLLTSVNWDDYLDSKTHWETLREGLERAKQLGLRVWIWDERGRPSGKAAGKVVQRYPEGQSRGLIHVALPVEGPRSCSVPLPEGPVVYARAIPWEGDHLDTAGEIRLEKSVEEGEVRADLPAGRWLVVALIERFFHAGTFGAELGQSGPEPYINIMDRRAAETFLEVNYEAYRAHVGDFFGDVIEGFQTEEVMLTTTAFPVGSDFPAFAAIPWLPEMPLIFSQRYGYDLLTMLPALFHEVGPRTARFRCDFYRLVAKLCGQAYFQTLADWCAVHGLESKAHPLGEESLVAHVAFEGSIFSYLEACHVPGVDVISATLETFKSRDQCLPAPKIVSSVAHVRGKRQVMCDFIDGYQRNAGITVDLNEMRGCIGWIYVQGVNRLVSLCNWHDRTGPEWQHLNDYAARLSAALSGGSHVADLAVLYPITTTWAHYTPSTGYMMLPPVGSLKRPKIWSETYAAYASLWEEGFRELVWGLLEHQRDFDIVDDGTVAASVVLESRLQVQDEDYRALILPPMDVIDRNSLEKAQRFAQAGGLVLGFYPLPDKSAQRGLDDKLRDTAEALFGSLVPLSGEYVVRQSGKGQSVLVADMQGLLKALKDLLPADITIEPQTHAVFGLHRRRDGQDIYFLTNNGPEPLDLIATLRATGRAEIWDPLTGTISEPENVERVDSMTRIPLVLDAYSGTLVVLTQDR